LLALAGILPFASTGLGQLSHPPAMSGSVAGLLPVPTLGGRQFWADDLLFRDWRIQHNVLSDQYRLLDGDNWRYAQGTFAECVAVLEKLKRDRKISPVPGPAVIVLHGLGRDRQMMEPLCHYLREHSRFQVFSFGYPSTQAGVAQHAQALARVIDRLEGIEELNFAAHSMGNLVVRHYLADRRATGHARPKLGRMVMLGPPNHGSEVATGLGQSDWFVAATGRAGLELGVKWSELEPRLMVPPCPFGIIAGGLGNAEGFNPLLAGDDDGLVTVDSTQLAGATDFVRLPVLHTLLPRDEKVLEYTLRFLESGCFVSSDQRHPLP
jgi:pimeloyl-ACP methyl ester carboxylesterase